jgi:hypothetical protein
MGIDGTNHIQIRGPKQSLDALEKTYLIIYDPTLNPETTDIITHLLGPKNVEKRYREPNYLVMTYPFRNKPIYDYLTQLLHKYPQCWIKNEYSTETGCCGLWIANMVNNSPSSQTYTWEEPCIEACAMGTDFSTQTTP